MFWSILCCFVLLLLNFFLYPEKRSSPPSRILKDEFFKIIHYYFLIFEESESNRGSLEGVQRCYNRMYQLELKSQDEEDNEDDMIMLFKRAFISLLLFIITIFSVDSYSMSVFSLPLENSKGKTNGFTHKCHNYISLYFHLLSRWLYLRHHEMA